MLLGGDTNVQDREDDLSDLSRMQECDRLHTALEEGLQGLKQVSYEGGTRANIENGVIKGLTKFDRFALKIPLQQEADLEGKCNAPQLSKIAARE